MILVGVEQTGLERRRSCVVGRGRIAGRRGRGSDDHIGHFCGKGRVDRDPVKVRSRTRVREGRVDRDPVKRRYSRRVREGRVDRDPVKVRANGKSKRNFYVPEK